MHELPAEAISQLQNGNKIGAIKVVREEHKIGLKEAKELVEAHLGEQQPETYPELKYSGPSPRAVVTWLGVIAAAAVLLFMSRS